MVPFLAIWARQVVEASMGECLDETSNGHQQTIAIEAHLFMNEAVFREELLYVVCQRVLALDGACNAEQQQGKEELFHEGMSCVETSRVTIANVTLVNRQRHTSKSSTSH